MRGETCERRTDECDKERVGAASWARQRKHVPLASVIENMVRHLTHPRPIPYGIGGLLTWVNEESGFLLPFCIIRLSGPFITNETKELSHNATLWMETIVKWQHTLFPFGIQMRPHQYSGRMRNTKGAHSGFKVESRTLSHPPGRSHPSVLRKHCSHLFRLDAYVDFAHRLQRRAGRRHLTREAEYPPLPRRRE